MPLAYSTDRSVRARVEEYIGCSLEHGGAVYITAGHPATGEDFRARPSGEFLQVLEQEGDLNRSLWDRGRLIAHLDLDYVNFDDSGQAYRNPAHVFGLHVPVVRAVEEVLLEYGLAPLHLLSGRGHHFSWAIGPDTEAFARLVSYGVLSDALRQEYLRPQAPDGSRVGLSMGAAFSGLGMLMEFLAHRVVRRGRGACPVAVQLTAVEVGPGPGGREIVSVDLSEYGDPLHRRTLRVPFSLYRKAQRLDADLGPMVMVPLHEMNVFQALGIMRDLPEAARLAGRASVQIPDQSRATLRLLDDYHDSTLHGFHRWFYSRSPEIEPAWLQGVVHQLPPCVTRPLEAPNDALLKPAVIQHVTRALLAVGWHPRHIAGLLQSRYQADHGWLPGIHFYDPGTRADFYVRQFAGLFAVGLDDLRDFNCVSTCEKGFCGAPAGCSLEPLRESGLMRRRSWRLGQPPYSCLQS